MKIINTLNASDVIDTQVTTPLHARQVVFDEPKPGFFRKISLGDEGISIQVANKGVMIPLAVLTAVAQAVEPALVTPTDAKVASDAKVIQSNL